MNRLFYLLILGLLSSLIFSCVLQDPLKRKSYGYFYNTEKGITTKAVEVDLDTMKSILVVPDILDFKTMMKNIDYFDSIITLPELELEIIKADKHDEVGALAGRIGLNNAARFYKPFLYLDLEIDEANPKYLELHLTDPTKFENIFVAKVFIRGNVSRSNLTYPLLNELILYIEEQSETYDRLEGVKKK